MRALTPEQLWSLPRVGAPAGGGRWVVVPVSTVDSRASTLRTRLHRVDPGDGSVRPLTSTGSSATRPSVDPEGRRVAFVREHEGRPTIHVMPLDGGEGRAVPVDGTAIGATWAPDGSFLVVVAVFDAAGDGTADGLLGVHRSSDAIYRYWDRWLTDGAVPHLFRVDPASGEARDLTPGAARWMRWDNTGDPVADVAVSPDGTTVVYCADRSDAPHRHLRWGLFSIDLATGEERLLTPDLEGHVTRPRYGPDGRLVVGIQAEPDYYASPVVLTEIDREGVMRRLDLGGWDRSPIAWEWQVGGLLATAEDEGTVRLFSVEEGAVPRPLTVGGSVEGFAQADGGVVVSHSSLLDPPELHRVDGGLRPITSFTTELMADIDRPTVDEIRVEGAEGASIQAYVLETGDGPRPLVHLIHGGPHGLFGDRWHWRWNALVLAGSEFSVALVNFAGSTSFGDAFARSIHGSWGDRPAADVEAVTDHLVEAGIADAERIAIAGGSYGGYLVTWLLTQTSRYRCAVAHAAVTDLVGMYASDITMGRARAYGAEAYEDLERVQRWSPMAHGAGLGDTPTLVTHGDRDYRVPIGQGLELYGMLQAKGVESRLVHFDDEGHWILDPRRSAIWYEEVRSWLRHHLLD